MTAAPRQVRGEVELAPGSVVFGDVHLDVSPDAAPNAPFEERLRALVRAGAPRLIVLGDLFDAWVGPAHVKTPAARSLCGVLGELSAAKVPVDLLHGNRDFLLDGRFERLCGARVHPAGLIGRLPGGQRVLFVHGDELCTRDRAYQRLKRVLRSPALVWLAPRLPGFLARRAARALRSSSVRAVAAKPQSDKEPQRDAALALASAAGCEQLVCGHVHRFRDEPLPGGRRWRIVDAWGGPRDLLRVRADGTLEAASSAALPPLAS